MSLLETMHKRQIQKKANNFIAKLSKLNEKQIEHEYLDNEELTNNEIVLSYLFFKHPNLIRILPLDFQISRINSNTRMFGYGSNEAKKKLVSNWLEQNKFFMNSLSLGLDEEEINSYLRLYFNQPDDVAKLYMDDLKRTITVLANTDIKQTEKIINQIKDKLIDRQWDFILQVNPIFIKYAPQSVQNKYSDKEEYAIYVGGEAKEKYFQNQIEKINEDINLLESSSIEIQKEYIDKYPYMINYIDEKILIELLKYDISLIRYVNLSTLKNEKDKTLEVIYGLLDNIENKTSKEIINIFVNKGILNAKGKLYRYDTKNNDITHQYTKRLIKTIQKLSLDQISSLIKIDVNYCLPYIAPVYNENTDQSLKERIIIDCNSRCLNLFKHYYGEELYSKYYKVINKIFNEYLKNMNKYDFQKDYNCILDLFKILFNKEIIKNNTSEKISIYIGMALMYKDNKNDLADKSQLKLLNELLSNAYKTKINNDKTIYNITSLEIFDSRLDFIDNELLEDYSNYNFVNLSSLLFIIKTSKVIDTYETYYKILSKLYGNNKECLIKSVEFFQYNYEILKDIEGKELNNEETENLVELLSTYENKCNIKKKEELIDYDKIYIKQVLTELSNCKNDEACINIICMYLFNKSYDDKGNVGWLESDTLKQVSDVFEEDAIVELEDKYNKVFSKEEAELFKVIKLICTLKDKEILLNYLYALIDKKIPRKVIMITNMLSKLKKYRLNIINSEIVTLKDIQNLYENNPSVITKNERDGVDIYSIIGQDFKIFCSTSNDGVNYSCVNVSALSKNSYAYDMVTPSTSLRFLDVDSKTTIKANKDIKNQNNMKPSFIVVVGALTDELLSIAKKNNLKIVEIQEGW